MDIFTIFYTFVTKIEKYLVRSDDDGTRKYHPLELNDSKINRWSGCQVRLKIFRCDFGKFGTFFGTCTEKSELVSIF